MSRTLSGLFTMVGGGGPPTPPRERLIQSTKERVLPPTTKWQQDRTRGPPPLLWSLPPPISPEGPSVCATWRRACCSYAAECVYVESAASVIS